MMTNPTPVPRLVDVFADVSCPFAHFSLQRFVARRAATGATDVALRVRAWPLELVNGEPLTAATVAEEVDDLRAQVAPDLFRGFDPAAFPETTVRLLGTATLAYRNGLEVGERFNVGLRESLFERGEPIAEDEVLGALARRHGVSVPDAETAAAAVQADLDEGRRRGVVGSPHFFVGQDAFFCPGLDIERRGEHLHISVDHHELDRFLGRTFADPG